MYIKLSREAYDQLVALSKTKRRDVRDQVAIIVEEYLAEHETADLGQVA